MHKGLRMPREMSSEFMERESAVRNQQGAVNEVNLVGIEDFVAQMAKGLVDAPDQVNVSVLGGRQTSVVELRVAKDDLGKVIGKRGKTADAMRTLLNAACSKMRVRAILEIVD